MVLNRHKTAIISDIHGNVPALNAVLNDIAANSVDEIIVAGDMVGRGPQGDEVVQILRNLTDNFIGGNHEDYLINFRDGNVPQDWLTSPQWAASRWMANQLSHASLEFIRNLPFSTTSTNFPDISVVHASPRSNREGIGLWTPESQLRDFLRMVDGGILVCGHTHRPFDYHCDIGRIINLGAVGLPFNNDRRAQYAIFYGKSDSSGANIEVERRKVDYDLDALLAIYRESRFLPEGGIVAHLLEMELLHAKPILVPYQKWVAQHDYQECESTLVQYLDEQ